MFWTFGIKTCRLSDWVDHQIIWAEDVIQLDEARPSRCPRFCSNKETLSSLWIYSWLRKKCSEKTTNINGPFISRLLQTEKGLLYEKRLQKELFSLCIHCKLHCTKTSPQFLSLCVWKYLIIHHLQLVAHNQRGGRGGGGDFCLCPRLSGARNSKRWSSQLDGTVFFAPAYVRCEPFHWNKRGPRGGEMRVRGALIWTHSRWMMMSHRFIDSDWVWLNQLEKKWRLK